MANEQDKRPLAERLEDTFEGWKHEGYISPGFPLMSMPMMEDMKKPDPTDALARQHANGGP